MAKLAGVDLHFLRWGTPAPGRPSIVLMHALGLVAGTWRDLASKLEEDFTVYALDRRSHGRSRVRGEATYAFSEFAEDLARFMGCLGLRGAVGVGHSAGATDLVLAEAGSAGLFSAILAVEPTVQDPRRHAEEPAVLGAISEMIIERTLRAPEWFRDREGAFEHFATRSRFRNWDRAILREYVGDGLESSKEGGVALSCPRETEAGMLTNVFLAMEHRYPGGEFAGLLEMKCPVLIVSAANSEAVFPPMARLAADLIPGAAYREIAGASHFLPQEQPDAFGDLVMTWAKEGR